MIMEARKFKICRLGQQAGDPRELMFQFQSESNLLEDSLFVLARLHLDEVHPHYGGESTILKSPD